MCMEQRPACKNGCGCLRPISPLRLSLLRLLDSSFRKFAPWAREFHPLKLRECLSQTLWNPESYCGDWLYLSVERRESLQEWLRSCTSTSEGKQACKNDSGVLYQFWNQNPQKLLRCLFHRCFMSTVKEGPRSSLQALCWSFRCWHIKRHAGDEPHPGQSLRGQEARNGKLLGGYAKFMHTSIRLYRWGS